MAQRKQWRVFSKRRIFLYSVNEYLILDNDFYLDRLSLFGITFLQLIQVQNLYMLQLVQAVYTSYNLYIFVVQVATCTKSQLVHNIYSATQMKTSAHV